MFGPEPHCEEPKLRTQNVIPSIKGSEFRFAKPSLNRLGQKILQLIENLLHEN